MGVHPTMKRATFLLLALVVLVNADLYLHNPRGSNNRNREANTNRNNGARLFDSQNNGKGGYCWGPQMYFFTGSYLRIEWTSQHSCGTGAGNGGKLNNHCQVVIQYMTDDGTPGYEVRDGNKGLYVADQTPGNSARSTRQNPGGGRSGFECSEERDYYPYWHPSPWKDIVVFTDDTSNCKYYKAESQNVKGKNYCSLPKYNQEQECLSNQGEWLEQPAWGIPAPDCLAAPENRDNHLGNGDGIDESGMPVTNHYNWKIPNDPTTAAVLRVRYNISSGDYDPWTTFSDKNGPEFFKNDPYVDVAPDESYGVVNMSLAVDTTQFARTFQDRSFTFEIRQRDSAILGRIHNLNVRGKRGNIVETYPATEYDFVPTNLEVFVNDYIHFQWTGCDTNPAGNAGEGTPGTDRSNIVVLGDQSGNMPGDQTTNRKQLFTDPEVRNRFAFLDQTGCLTYEELLNIHGDVNAAFEEDPQNCMKLNAAEPYFDGGLVKMTNSGKYNYTSTRNNNFTNRSQKASITVTTMLPTWAIVVVAAGSVVFIGAIVLAIVQMRA